MTLSTLILTCLVTAIVVGVIVGVVAKYSLDSKLRQKATGDREHSIKYTSIYGMPNYTFATLEGDISEILSTSYKPLTKEEKQQKIETVHEQTKNNIPEPIQLKIQFEETNRVIKELLSRKAGKSEKIEELVKDGKSGEKSKVICISRKNELPLHRIIGSIF